MKNQETENQQKETNPVSTVTELAKMDIQCHLLIIDSDTDEILVNQRG